MYEKIERLMKEKGVKPSDVAKAVGISSSVFTDWKKGRYTPKADKLFALSRYFGVPMEYFFDFADSVEYDMQQAQNDFEDSLRESAKEFEKPLYRASAGEGAYNDTYTSDSITMGEEGYEYVEIVGNSMSPILEDGDIVTVELTTEVSPHDLAVVKIDGETACVKYCEITDHGIWLKAENKSVYEDRFYSISQVLTLPITVLGRVIELRRKIK